MNLIDYFDRVLVISLSRSPQRWSAFLSRLSNSSWPFKAPERIEAVDGVATGSPWWWKQGDGAWGCLMSHARILEDVLRNGLRRVLVMEDDAVLCEDFAARCASFLMQVPVDWDQLYFGGQHLVEPIRLSDSIVRARNVNRTHCYAITGDFAKVMYQSILDAEWYAVNRGHIDHRLGAMHQTTDVRVYCPCQWLVGQAEGPSSISGRSEEQRFWARELSCMKTPIVLVLDTFGGFSGEVAMILKSLGVHFGNNVGGFPYSVEDAGLAFVCEEVLPTYTTKRLVVPFESGLRLRDWASVVLREAEERETIAGACYPQLLAMNHDWQESGLSKFIIHVLTPEEESQRRAAALLRIRGAASSDVNESMRAFHRLLTESRRDWEADNSLTITSDDLKNKRDRVVDQLAILVTRLRKQSSRNDPGSTPQEISS